MDEVSAAAEMRGLAGAACFEPMDLARGVTGIYRNESLAGVPLRVAHFQREPLIRTWGRCEAN